MALIEPRGSNAGSNIDLFPPSDSPLHVSNFFPTLYQRYEERFVYGAPLLADRSDDRWWCLSPTALMWGRPDNARNTCCVGV